MKSRLLAPAFALVMLATQAGAQRAEAVFAGGCFWGVQWVFEHVRGVTTVVSGYSGGSVPDPTYELVGTGRTGAHRLGPCASNKMENEIAPQPPGKLR
jgi:peptide-methionine (S)-S-oxide reductase